MNTLPPRRAETLWLLAGGALLLLALAWAVTTTFTKHRQAAARLAEIEPRHARLAGLLEGSERFVQADATLRANLAQFVHPIDADASQIGNTALQRVRDLATARGLRVSSSQAAAAREDKGFDRIGLNLRVEGEWPQLVELLRELPQQRPVIYATGLQLGAQFVGRQQQDAPPTVYGQFDLYVLKERTP